MKSDTFCFVQLKCKVWVFLKGYAAKQQKIMTAYR